MAIIRKPDEILDTILEEGEGELQRGSTGLAFSGFAAGLNISFVTVALAYVGLITGGPGLASLLFYPIGFLLVVFGRAELFTTNTVTPVKVVLERLSTIPNMLRLWAVVFVFNVLGTVVFAATVVYGEALQPSALELVLGEVAPKLEYGFWITTLKAVLGGWLVALIPWLAASTRDTISQVIFVYLLVLLVAVGALPHCIAGSAEVLISVFAGQTSLSEYLGGFLLPATLGNALGGVFLVTLLNYGQVAGSEKRIPLVDKYTDGADQQEEES